MKKVVILSQDEFETLESCLARIQEPLMNIYRNNPSYSINEVKRFIDRMCEIILEEGVE